eukprot:EG_transcript_24242
MSVNQAARVVAKCTKEYLDPVYKQHRLDAVQYKTICKEVCQDIFKVHGFESLQNDDVPPNVRAEVQMLVKKALQSLHLLDETAASSTPTSTTSKIPEPPPPYTELKEEPKPAARLAPPVHPTAVRADPTVGRPAEKHPASARPLEAAAAAPVSSAAMPGSSAAPSYVAPQPSSLIASTPAKTDVEATGLPVKRLKTNDESAVVPNLAAAKPPLAAPETPSRPAAVAAAAPTPKPSPAQVFYPPAPPGAPQPPGPVSRPAH